MLRKKNKKKLFNFPSSTRSAPAKTQTRFKEAPFCAFGNKSWLNAYGTSMRSTGEIIGKVAREIVERGSGEGSRG
jgi:hypothetical protein